MLVKKLNPLYQTVNLERDWKEQFLLKYISMLNKITRCIFPESDDKVLNYLDEDGILVEPDYYLPIVPMILVNGGKGIGTGFSYEVLQYNLLTICNYLKNRLNGVKQEVDWTPYYENFKGSIQKMDNGKFMIKVVSALSARYKKARIANWFMDCS